MYFSDKSTCSNSLHPTEVQEYSFPDHPLTQDDYYMEASAVANNDTLMDLFQYDMYVGNILGKNLPLPQGWTMVERKQSIFELDTNIHTLSELYNSLVDLRSHLPDPVAMELEMPFRKPSLLKRESSVEDFVIRSRSGSSNIGSVDSPMVSSREDGDNSDYTRFLYAYPNFIFEALVQLYLECVSFTRLHPEKLKSRHKQGKLDKAYACAIYAYGSLHAILCHSERFGIYSFMNQLSREAYQVAFELVEFDGCDVTTIETLVIMSQYLSTLGQDGEAINIFCLAQRQISVLLANEKNLNQDVHRLFIWMTEFDWVFALTRLSTPVIQYDQVKKSLNHLKQTSENDGLYVKAKKFEMKGLSIILFPEQPSPHRSLNQWRSKYLGHFLYRRVASQSYTLEDKYALRLHAIYFAGMLELHKQHMLSGFNQERTPASTAQWTGYFYQPEMADTQQRVEKGLYRSMSAAYGFIQVIQLLLEEKDRCILPQMIDVLSTACAVLYFGNKVVVSDKQMIQKSEEALSFIVHKFLNSTTYEMIECPRVDMFIKKWRTLIK